MTYTILQWNRKRWCPVARVPAISDWNAMGQFIELLMRGSGVEYDVDDGLTTDLRSVQVAVEYNGSRMWYWYRPRLTTR